MDPLEKATAILSAASGADATAVAEQLKSESDPQAIADALFETKLKAEYDRGNSNAIGKTRREVERQLREAGAEGASFDKLSEALASLKAPAGSPDGKLTGADALKHPDVVAKFNELKAGTQQEIDKAVEAARKELAGRETALLNQNVRAYYEAQVDALNPNYTPGKEAAQRKRLVDELASAGAHRLNQEGKPELVDEHGELLTGDRGKLITPSDRARERAEELYGLPVAKQKDAPNVKPGDTTTAAYDGPKTQAEYEVKLNELRPGSPEKIKLINDFKAYKETQTTA